MTSKRCSMVAPPGAAASPSRPPVRPKEAWGAWEPSPKATPRADSKASRQQKSNKEAVPRANAARKERCSKCSKVELWAAYDVFRQLDKRHRGKIGRIDFFDALKDRPSLDWLKVMKRSQLDHRFRESTQDVTLEEFLLRLWPSATPDDLVKMTRWGQLREAQAVLRDGNFRGETSELRKIFDLLDENGDQTLTIGELTRAEILSHKEVELLMSASSRGESVLTFHDFCHYVQQHLTATYCTPDTKKLMMEEALAQTTGDFQSTFRSAVKKV